jgi:hypothetical protein|nr:MAG TPA: histone chaperone [Crassvirales sp.]
METKEIKINIPKGYEIDKENSTFECIKFKSKKDISNLTYKDVCKRIFLNNEGYYIDIDGKIINDGLYNEYITDPNNAPREIQLKRLLALNQLMNIAYYYNGKQYMRVGYYIGYNRSEDKYSVNNLDDDSFEPAGVAAIFMYAKDAQAVIDNPNFRSILDTLCK